jgi:hypothetical protein
MRIDTPVLEDAKALLDELKQAYLTAPTTATAQNLDKGVKAYWRRDYTAALAQLLPFAERGDATAQYLVGSMCGEDRSDPCDVPALVRKLSGSRADPTFTPRYDEAIASFEPITDIALIHFGLHFPANFPR